MAGYDERRAELRLNLANGVFSLKTRKEFLKMGGFVGQTVAHFDAPQRSTTAPSSPRRPRYNAAAKASLGAVKTRALAIATSHGRPQFWTCDDLEAARVEANRDAGPWGPILCRPTGVMDQPLAHPRRRPPTLQPGRRLRLRRRSRSARPVCCGRPGLTPAVPFGASQRAVLVRRAHPPSPSGSRLSFGQENRELVHLIYRRSAQELSGMHRVTLYNGSCP